MSRPVRPARASTRRLAGAALMFSLGFYAGRRPARRRRIHEPTIVTLGSRRAFERAPRSWNSVIADLYNRDMATPWWPSPTRCVVSRGTPPTFARAGQAVKGPVVLVGRSYAGRRGIRRRQTVSPNVRGPRLRGRLRARGPAETISSPTGRFPGSTLGPTLAPPVPLPGRSQDLYVQQDRFPAQFAADLPDRLEARVMSAEQRPVTPSGGARGGRQRSCWKSVICIMVDLWNRRRQHPTHRAGVHGPARSRSRDGRRGGGLPYGDAVASRRGDRVDRGCGQRKVTLASMDRVGRLSGGARGPAS